MLATLLLLLTAPGVASTPEDSSPPPVSLPADMFQGQIDSSHFSFFYMEGNRGVASYLADQADAHRAKVLADLGHNRPDATRVLLTKTTSDMQRILRPARVPSWVAGMALPRHNLILIRTRSRAPSMSQLEQVFVHEWAHLALDHAVDFNPLPRWFKEGFAIYQSGEWSFGRARSLAGGVLSKRLFTLEALDEQFPTQPLDVELAYAQSIDFIGFLLGEYGPEPFHQMIRLLSRGWPFFLAVEEAYQDGLFAIEEAWHGDLKLRFTWIPLLTGTAFLWFLASVVFILAYVRKRRTRRLALASLDDEDGTPPDAGAPISLNPPDNL